MYIVHASFLIIFHSRQSTYIQYTPPNAWVESIYLHIYKRVYCIGFCELFTRKNKSRRQYVSCNVITRCVRCLNIFVFTRFFSPSRADFHSTPNNCGFRFVDRPSENRLRAFFLSTPATTMGLKKRN